MRSVGSTTCTIWNYSLRGTDTNKISFRKFGNKPALLMAGAEGLKKVVLLSCGSFNPITNMHLRMLELARDALHKTGIYSVVEGIISPVNDDYNKMSKKKLVKASHRIVMAELAVQTSNWIHVDDWETKQSSWLETLNILKHTEEAIRIKYSSSSPGSAIPQVKLLCGGDLLESFAVPNLWQDEHIKAIVGDYGLVVITRQGADPETFIYESDVLTEYKGGKGSPLGAILAPCSYLIKVALVTCEKSIVQFASTQYSMFSPGTLVSSCSNTGPMRVALAGPLGKTA